MECLYCPELSHESSSIVLRDEEFRHLQVLRIREAELIMLSNGEGLCCEAEIVRRDKSSAELRPLQFLEGHAELSFAIELVVACLDVKERMEWIVEKATELGVCSITFVRSRYSSQRPLATSRLAAKALSAMKQCKRAVLPKINEATSLASLLENCKAQHIVLADIAGHAPQKLREHCCVFIGPEGGFDEAERSLIVSDRRTQLWRLAPARLRAETAAISMMAQLAIG